MRHVLRWPGGRAVEISRLRGPLHMCLGCCWGRGPPRGGGGGSRHGHLQRPDPGGGRCGRPEAVGMPLQAHGSREGAQQAVRCLSQGERTPNVVQVRLPGGTAGLGCQLSPRGRGRGGPVGATGCASLAPKPAWPHGTNASPPCQAWRLPRHPSAAGARVPAQQLESSSAMAMRGRAAECAPALVAAAAPMHQPAVSAGQCSGGNARSPSATS